MVIVSLPSPLFGLSRWTLTLTLSLLKRGFREAEGCLRSRGEKLLEVRDVELVCEECLDFEFDVVGVLDLDFSLELEV